MPFNFIAAVVVVAVFTLPGFAGQGSVETQADRLVKVQSMLGFGLDPRADAAFSITLPTRYTSLDSSAASF